MHKRAMRNRGGIYNPATYDVAPGGVPDPYLDWYEQAPDANSLATRPGGHPFHDTAHNDRLLAREHEITLAFERIVPTLKEVAGLQYQENAVQRIQSLLRDRLGFELAPERLQASWIKPLNMRGLYADSVFHTFCQLANRDFDRNAANLDEGEPADEVIRKWGFHAIDITPCADGRLSGVVDYILRIPPVVVTSRKSFAGSLFDIEESVRNWVEVELRRHREAQPNPADEPTRYLKIGVYHTSSSDPDHEGCAAHGSDVHKAASALLERLNAFAAAIENSHCCGAQVATLLLGVDTDTDAIRLHVPDANGAMDVTRFIDNQALFEQTRSLSREAAKEAIRAAVAQAAGVAEDDAATEGMRWFCGYLLKNNMSQIEYVRAYHAGCYQDLGHTERFITVGDSFDDVQMRNLAYQAQMETIEEGAADMDVGIKIFKKVNMTHGLPIPAFIHFRYDGRVPDSRQRAVQRCLRLRKALHARYPELIQEGWLYSYATIKDQAPGSRLENIDTRETAASGCACGCNKSESRT